jgi:hypothetical protein
VSTIGSIVTTLDAISPVKLLLITGVTSTCARVPPAVMRVPGLRPAGTATVWHGLARARVAAGLLGLTAVLIADAIPNGPLASLRNWEFDAYERHWPRSRGARQTLIIGRGPRLPFH